MYSSNSNGNTNTTTTTTNPITYSLYDINPTSNSKQEDLHSSLFHFPSPYIHYEDDVIFLQHLHDLLLQQQQQQPPLTADDEGATATTTAAAPEVMTTTNMANSNKQCRSVIPRKRSSKKDRHSKINTAQGPRDRRMRLSLEVAREFFNLQDMLGFDKASRTVEWLLTKSKAAIKELTRGLPRHMKHSCSVGGGANSASSTSECEVVSGIDESAGGIDGNLPGRTVKAKPSSASLTLEAMNHDMNRIGSWSPFENGEESGINPHLEVLADVHEELSSSMIFNYDPHNSGINSQESGASTFLHKYTKEDLFVL